MKTGAIALFAVTAFVGVFLLTRAGSTPTKRPEQNAPTREQEDVVAISTPNVPSAVRVAELETPSSDKSKPREPSTTKPEPGDSPPAERPVHLSVTLEELVAEKHALDKQFIDVQQAVLDTLEAQGRFEEVEIGKEGDAARNKPGSGVPTLVVNRMHETAAGPKVRVFWVYPADSPELANIVQQRAELAEELRRREKGER